MAQSAVGEIGASTPATYKETLPPSTVSHMKLSTSQRTLSPSKAETMLTPQHTMSKQQTLSEDEDMEALLKVIQILSTANRTLKQEVSLLKTQLSHETQKMHQIVTPNVRTYKASNLKKTDLHLSNVNKAPSAEDRKTFMVDLEKDKSLHVHSIIQKRPSNLNQSDSKKQCRYCGNRHRRGSENCPAFGKVCYNCKKDNHFSRVCQSSAEFETNKAKSNEHNDNKKYIICKFDKCGFCKFGINCRYKHLSGNSDSRFTITEKLENSDATSTNDSVEDCEVGENIESKDAEMKLQRQISELEEKTKQLKGEQKKLAKDKKDFEIMQKFLDLEVHEETDPAESTSAETMGTETREEKENNMTRKENPKCIPSDSESTREHLSDSPEETIFALGKIEMADDTLNVTRETDILKQKEEEKACASAASVTKDEWMNGKMEE